MIILDTNIVILYLQGENDICQWIDDCLSKGKKFAISSITVVELMSYPKISLAEIFQIEQWLHAVLVVNIDTSIAREAARLRRVKAITTTDAVIAATAILFKVSLATRDKRLSKMRDLNVVMP